jgi:hypothetical protein
MTEQQTVTPDNGGEPSAERTLGRLIADATGDLTEIVRAEIALAKAELGRDVRNGAMAGGLFGAAGYLGLLASITAVIGIGYALTETGLRPWAAFFIVTAVLLLVAGLLVLIGRSRVRQVGPPARTIRSARETVAAVRPDSFGR